MNNLTGQKFNLLKVINLSEKKADSGHFQWDCICDCGNQTVVRSDLLRSGRAKSCGCLALGEDLIGKTFGRLKVVCKDSDWIRGSNAKWKCKCECGNFIVVTDCHLKNNHTQSCGCYRKDNLTTHAMSRSSEYSIWVGMKNRCFNENSHATDHYGGRGITVCDRWKNSFEAFYADMGPRPSDDHSIDRYPNNDGNYEPGNCRWATQQEQCNNTRRNIYHEYQNKQFTKAELSRELGIPVSMLIYRLDVKGQTVEEAINTKSRFSK